MYCASGSSISKRRFSVSDTPTADTCEESGVSASAKVCDSPISGHKKSPGWDYKTSISFKIYVSVHKPRISGRKPLQQNINGHWLWILAETQVFLKFEVVSGSSASWQVRTRLVFWTWSSTVCVSRGIFLGLEQLAKDGFQIVKSQRQISVTSGTNCSLKTIVLKPNAQDIDHYRG